MSTTLIFALTIYFIACTPASLSTPVSDHHSSPTVNMKSAPSLETLVSAADKKTPSCNNTSTRHSVDTSVEEMVGKPYQSQGKVKDLLMQALLQGLKSNASPKKEAFRHGPHGRGGYDYGYDSMDGYDYGGREYNYGNRWSY